MKKIQIDYIEKPINISDYYWNNFLFKHDVKETWFTIRIHQKRIIDVCYTKSDEYGGVIEMGIHHFRRTPDAMKEFCRYLFETNSKLAFISIYNISGDFIGDYILKKSYFDCAVVRRKAVKIASKKHDVKIYVKYSRDFYNE